MVWSRNVAWLSASLMLGLLMLALSPLPIAGDLEARGLSLLTPVLSAVSAATRPFAQVVLHAGQLEQLAGENADLREQVARLEAEAAAVRAQQTAADQTRALQAAVGSAASYLRATVIVRDPAPGRRAMVIDRGTSDGVFTGQPILGPAATLVGVVTEVHPQHARVRLLDDPNSAVAAMLQQSKTLGALAGNESGLQLEYVPTGTTVSTGDIVLSSPLGGLLPAGLLIGRVASTEARPEAMFTVIRVEPYTDYSRLDHVLVVTTYVPGTTKP